MKWIDRVDRIDRHFRGLRSSSSLWFFFDEKLNKEDYNYLCFRIWCSWCRSARHIWFRSVIDASVRNWRFERSHRRLHHSPLQSINKRIIQKMFTIIIIINELHITHHTLKTCILKWIFENKWRNTQFKLKANDQIIIQLNVSVITLFSVLSGRLSWWKIWFSFSHHFLFACVNGIDNQFCAQMNLIQNKR